MLGIWIKKNVFRAILRLLPATIPATLADALMLLGIRSFVDIIGGNLDWTILEWLFSMILVVFLRFFFLKLRTEISEKFFRHFGATLQGRFLKVLRSIHPSFYHLKDSDAKLRSAFEATEILPKSGEGIYQALQALVQLVVFFPVLFWISTPLTLLLLFFVLPLVLFSQKKIRNMGHAEKETLFEFGRLRSDFETTKDIYRHWSEKKEKNVATKKMFQQIRLYLNSASELEIRKKTLALAIESVSVLAMLFVLSACAFMIFHLKMAPADLVLYASAIFLCYKPVKDCSRVIPQLRSATVAYGVLKELEKFSKRNKQIRYGDSLELRQIKFCYHQFAVFNNFSLKQAVDSSCPIFLHGENGVGKSTLLRVLSGIEEPECGELILPKEAEQGVFFCSQALFLPPLDFFEESLETISQCQDSAFLEFLKESESLSLIKKSGHSGGERSRLALLLALLSKSRFILLDEVFSNIAVTQREKILESFLEAAAKKNKVVLITGHEHWPKSVLEKGFHLTLDKTTGENFETA